MKDDLYTAVPAISIAMPVSGPLSAAMSDVDTNATSTNTQFSVDANVVEPPQATGTIPAPGVAYADIDFNTVCETNKTITNNEAAKSSPASTGDEFKSPNLKDQGIISKDHFVPPVSPCPVPRYADKSHQQSQDNFAFDQLRRTKRADPSNAFPNGHSRNISDSSDALTLVDSTGGGSRKHSLAALDLASFTQRIEDSCHKSMVANPELQDAAQDSMRFHSDPANANGVEHQLQVSIDLAHSKVEAYQLAATTLRTEKEALIKDNDIALQRATRVARGLRYELECLKENNAQSLKKGMVRNDAEKAALRAENTQLCGTINDMGLQLGLLQSSYHFLETEYESEKREHVKLSESYLRLVQGRIEQLGELKALEKEIATVRHGLGGLAGDCFERMVRLTLALKDQGINAMDEEHKKICERAPYHVGFDERDIVKWVNEEIEEERNGKDQAAGGEAGNENRSYHVILDQAYDVKAPKSDVCQESPETHNVRRQREIAEAEERLLGPIGIAISADGTVKDVQAAKGQLHPDQSHHALNSSPAAGTIDDNTPSKTGKSKEISGEDWQNGASEVRSVFQHPRPANYELLDHLAAGSSVKGQLVTNDDLRNVLPGLKVNVTIPNHGFEIEETDLNSKLNPANAGPKRSGHARDIPSLSSKKSASSFETDTMEGVPPQGYMAKPSPDPDQWDEFEVAHQDPVISSTKGAAATDVDRNLHPSRDDKAWLQDVLANIAKAKNDRFQSWKDSVACQLHSEAEEDLAASSDCEGEDLEDNQDQVFVDDGDYVGNDCNESLVSDAVDTKPDAMPLRKSIRGIYGPPTSPKSYSPPQLSTFSFSSEDLGQPGLSCLDDNSGTAIGDDSQDTRPAIPITQSTTPPIDKKPIEQAKPMDPDPNILEPTLSSAETTEEKPKATKPKMNVAAAIALEKRAKELAETAEEKQREFSKKQREAAARRKKDAGGKGGRA